MTDREVKERLWNKKIKISTVSDFCMDEKETDSHQFILNYSNMDVEKLEGAIEELKSLL